MPYAIDQSNKMEYGKGPTAVALANDHDYAVLIPVKERRAAFSMLQSYYDRKTITILLFSAAVYFLIRQLPSGATVTIDTEYSGQSRYIRAVLLGWIRQDRPDITAAHIVFQSVGDSSRAHKRALATHRGKMNPDRILRADDLCSMIIGSKIRK